MLFEYEIQQSSVKIACSQGCSYCCRHNRVEVFIFEVFVIVDYINRTFSKKRIDQLIDSLRSTVLAVSNETATIHSHYFKKCVLLENDQCLVYDVRPINCRQFHSIDLSLCEKKFNNPSFPVKDPSDKKLRRRLHAVIAGFEDAFVQKRFDMTRYELNQALLTLLEDPNLMQDLFKLNIKNNK